MATRFKLPAAGASAVNPAFQFYGHSNQAVRRPLPLTDSSALATTNVSPDSADHLVAGDVLSTQFVSAPLADQTIASQTVKLNLQALEANAANNLFVQLWLGVVTNGGTALSTILTKSSDGLELGTTLSSRTMSFTTSAYTIAVGDVGARIVAEIALAGTPTAATGTQGHNGSTRFGANGAGGDLLENDTQTGTTLNPWLEFANTLTFVALGTGGGTLDSLTSGGTGTVLGQGTAAITLEALTVSGTGTVANPGANGTLAVTLEGVAGSAAGVAMVAGSGAVTLAEVAVAGIGTLPVAGVAGSTLAALAVSSAVQVLIQGIFSSIPGLTLVAEGHLNGGSSTIAKGVGISHHNKCNTGGGYWGGQR